MRAMKRITALIVLFCLLLLSGCTADPQQTTAAPAADITRGRVQGNVYTCEFLGLTYTLPEGQAFYNDEYLAHTQNFTATEISDEEMYRLLQETGHFVDMQTYEVEEITPFLSLTYVDRNAGPAFADAREYFENDKESRLRLFESYGFKDVRCEVEDYELAGVQCASQVVRAYTDDAMTYQRTVGIIRDHYIALVTASGGDEKDVETLLRGFHWLQS